MVRFVRFTYLRRVAHFERACSTEETATRPKDGVWDALHVQFIRGPVLDNVSN